MRKRILYIFLFFVFALSSIGCGMVIAEKKIRKAKAGNGSSSGNIVIINSDAKPEQADIKSSEENNTASDPPLVNSAPSIEQVNVDKSEFSFAILGDTQAFEAGNSRGNFQRAVASIKKFDPDLVLSTGDLVSSCSGDSDCEKKLNDWKNVMGTLAAKSYVVMGNHDSTGDGKADALWQKFFDLPTNGPPGFSELAYSFNYENAHIVALDTDKPDEHIINKDQRDWLEKDLAGNKKELTFVFFHEPAFPVKSKIDESLDEDKKDRDDFWKIIDKYNVTAVFSGHEHLNSRRKINASIFPGAQHEIYQFITGNTDTFNHDAPKPGIAEYFYRGNDFELVSVKDNQITMKVYTVDGSLLNTFTFSK